MPPPGPRGTVGSSRASGDGKSQDFGTGMHGDAWDGEKKIASLDGPQAHPRSGREALGAPRGLRGPWPGRVEGLALRRPGLGPLSLGLRAGRMRFPESRSPCITVHPCSKKAIPSVQGDGHSPDGTCAAGGFRPPGRSSPQGLGKQNAKGGSRSSPLLVPGRWARRVVLELHLADRLRQMNQLLEQKPSA